MNDKEKDLNQPSKLSVDDCRLSLSVSTLKITLLETTITVRLDYKLQVAACESACILMSVALYSGMCCVHFSNLLVLKSR